MHIDLKPLILVVIFLGRKCSKLSFEGFVHRMDVTQEESGAVNARI